MSGTGRGRVIPGFLIKNFFCNSSIEENYDDMLLGAVTVHGWDVQRQTYRRFLEDKTLYADEKCCFVLEGVILNKSELCERYAVASIVDLVHEMRLNEGECFFKAFRGSFSGAYYDVSDATWTIWTNHYGNSTIFYYASQGNVCVGSNYWEVLRATKAQTKVSVDECAIISMLTYGGMNYDQTYTREIKRLLPGHYLRISSTGECCVREYWHFSHDVYNLSNASESEIISGLDRRFRKAVDRQFSKDAEYGYRHLAGLSGGLDSRMITWVARDLGYSDIVNYTFGQAGCLDEIIAKKLATDLGNQFIFMPLDDAGFLKDLDEIIQLNFGLTVYSGTTGQRRFLSILDIDSFGLIHCGTLGDVVIGSYLDKPSESLPINVGGLYSPMLKEDASAITDFSRYEDQDEYLLSTRGFLTIATSELVLRGFSDVASPFLDLDVFEYCMSIPLEYRCRHRIYKEWILNYYPEAADYVWEKCGAPLSAGRTMTWLLSKYRTVRVLGARGVISEVLRRLGLRKLEYTPVRGGMNPFDLWLADHPNLKTYLDGVYQDEIELLSESGFALQDKVRFVFEHGSALDNTLVLTVLHSIRKVLDA